MRQIIAIGTTTPGNAFDAIFWPSICFPYCVVAAYPSKGSFCVIPCETKSQVDNILMQYTLFTKIVIDRSEVEPSSRRLSSFIDWNLGTDTTP